MKKLSTLFFFCSLSVVLFTTNVHGQTILDDFFVGTWNMKAYNLPQGDTEMIIQLEKKMANLPEVL